MKHKPVLLKEVIQHLDPKSNENFIDSTFGEGGHSLEILNLTAPEGKLLGIDLDPSTHLDQARNKSLGASNGFRLDSGSANLKASEPLVPRSSLSEAGLSWSGIEPESLKKFQDRLFLEIGNFSDIKNISSKYFPNGVDGVLFDFGFRSFHIDESGRGFSYTKNEPLDMRFYRSETSIGSITASDIVNSWSEQELERIFNEYGEERDSKKIAKAIAEARKQRRILTTRDLVEILDRTHRSDRSYKTYGRIFQALRIAVNNELENIKQGLAGAWSILKPNGRIVAISFHSLEDRIVKNFFNEKKQLAEGNILTKKPVIATDEEINNNVRSRSAKLRVIRKI